MFSDAIKFTRSNPKLSADAATRWGRGNLMVIRRICRYVWYFLRFSIAFIGFLQSTLIQADSCHVYNRYFTKYHL